MTLNTEPKHYDDITPKSKPNHGFREFVLKSTRVDYTNKPHHKHVVIPKKNPSLIVVLERLNRNLPGVDYTNEPHHKH
eukprot:Pgem_evm2s11727